MIDTINKISKIPLFETLDNKTLTKIANNCKIKIYQMGDMIIKGGNETQEVFFVLEGAVKIFKELSEDGKEKVILADFSKGEFFGEISAIDSKPRSAFIKAMNTTEIMSMNGSFFVDILKTSPVVAYKVSKKLVSIIRGLNSRVAELNALSIDKRIFNELIRVAEPSIEDTKCWNVVVSDDYSLLSSETGASAIQITKTIKYLENEKIIDLKNNIIKIKNWEKLNSLAKL